LGENVSGIGGESEFYLYYFGISQSVDLMKPNTTRTPCFLILSLSLVLVTAQGISSNYIKLWAEGLQSSNNEKPRIIEIQDDS
jgi:hypothetical protein